MGDYYICCDSHCVTHLNGKPQSYFICVACHAVYTEPQEICSCLHDRVIKVCKKCAIMLIDQVKRYGEPKKDNPS